MPFAGPRCYGYRHAHPWQAESHRELGPVRGPSKIVAVQAATLALLEVAKAPARLHVVDDIGFDRHRKQHIYKNMGFDPQKDLLPITMVASVLK